MDMRLGFLQEFTSKASWDSFGKTGGVVDEVMKGSDCAFSRSQLLVRTTQTVKRSLEGGGVERVYLFQLPSWAVVHVEIMRDH